MDLRINANELQVKYYNQSRGGTFGHSSKTEYDCGLSSMFSTYSFNGITIGYGDIDTLRNVQLLIDGDLAHLEMQFQLYGSISYTGDALQNRFLTLQSGHCSLFYSNGEGGRIHVPKLTKAHTAIGIRISPLKLRQYFGSYISSDLETLLKSVANNTGYIHPSEVLPINPEMGHVIQSMVHCKYQGTLLQLFLESKVMELLTLVLFHQKARDDKSAQMGRALKQRLLAIQDHIAKTYDQPHSLKVLATESGLNEYDLKKYYKQLFGRTVFESIRDTRLMQGKKMLLEGGLSIAEITYRVGYKSPQHFSTAFKKRFGYSPSSLLKGFR